ncbi:MAG TPA: hypothetical protein VNF47_19410 [Streptosporangiaceae bacterium]|nr:hypothetical protein [Streptosporangiaceae bacterium]
MDTAAALAAITAARELAAGLEHGELAFIDAARSGGATWSQIASAMGARNRQTAQKRHADLARRRTCPPAVDIPAPAGPFQQETGHDDGPAAGDSPARAWARNPTPDSGNGLPAAPDVPPPAADAGIAPTRTARSQQKQCLPTITDEIIREGIYELARAPDHRETRSWHVIVSGTRVGLVRPTWRGERGRPGWEAADNAGVTLPPAGIGRITSAGNARTRDAAAVSLLHALQRQQANESKHKRRR